MDFSVIKLSSGFLLDLNMGIQSFLILFGWSLIEYTSVCQKKKKLNELFIHAMTIQFGFIKSYFTHDTIRKDDIVNFILQFLFLYSALSWNLFSFSGFGNIWKRSLL